MLIDNAEIIPKNGSFDKRLIKGEYSYVLVIFIERIIVDYSHIIQSSVDHLKSKVALLEAMWRDPFVQMYQDKELPTDGRESVFLEGPTSRKEHINHNYRSQQVSLLRGFGWDGWIFVPETRGLVQFYGRATGYDFTEKEYIHNWESSRIMASSRVSCWIPRDNEDQLGLNTNLELGIEIGRKLERLELERFLGHLPTPARKLFIGWPSSAQRMGLPKHYVDLLRYVTIYDQLDTMCKAIAYSP